jgi:hypothetical protein
MKTQPKLVRWNCIGDVFATVTIIPFIFWLSWWGIAASMSIGWVLNLIQYRLREANHG